MPRVALYARYSSNAQSASSIADQFRLCREPAEHEGWMAVGTYHDVAVSGPSVTLISFSNQLRTLLRKILRAPLGRLNPPPIGNPTP